MKCKEWKWWRFPFHHAASFKAIHLFPAPSWALWGAETQMLTILPGLCSFTHIKITEKSSRPRKKKQKNFSDNSVNAIKQTSFPIAVSPFPSIHQCFMQTLSGMVRAAYAERCVRWCDWVHKRSRSNDGAAGLLSLAGDWLWWAI